MIDRTWEDVTAESHPRLWSILTDENAKPQINETGSDGKKEGDDHILNRKI